VARLDRFTDIAPRVNRVMRTHYTEISKSVGRRLVDMAHELAQKSPVDTSYLLSGFQVGTRYEDFPDPHQYIHGKGGDTRTSSIAKLGLDNTQVVDRRIQELRLSSVPRVRWQLINRTDYLKYVIQRVGDFVSPIVKPRVARIRQAYLKLRVSENANRR